MKEADIHVTRSMLYGFGGYVKQEATGIYWSPTRPVKTQSYSIMTRKKVVSNYSYVFYFRFMNQVKIYLATVLTLSHFDLALDRMFDSTFHISLTVNYQHLC